MQKKTEVFYERRIIMRKPIHTVHNPNGGWDNKRECNSNPISHANTKDAAEILGREQAKIDKVEHIIHNIDGKIAEKNSYEKDPYPPKG
jgi:hypothetical protein